MDFGSLVEWLIGGATILVVLAGQVVLFTKFKTIVETTLDHHKDRLDTHDTRHDKQDACIASIKKRSTDFMTEEQSSKNERACREDLIARITEQDKDIGKITSAIHSLEEKVAETNLLVAQLITLQTGEIGKKRTNGR